MALISFGEGFLIVLEIGSFLVSLSNEAAIGLTEGFDGGLIVIGFDSDSTSIVVIGILFEFEGVLELAGGGGVLVFDVGFGLGVSGDLFARVVIFLEVFDRVFHLIEIGREFEVDGGGVGPVDGGSLFGKDSFLGLVQTFSVRLVII